MATKVAFDGESDPLSGGAACDLASHLLRVAQALRDELGALACDCHDRALPCIDEYGEGDPGCLPGTIFQQIFLVTDNLEFLADQAIKTHLT